jgi:hypothetical protein
MCPFAAAQKRSRPSMKIGRKIAVSCDWLPP